jgi:hypothetical protein
LLDDRFLDFQDRLGFENGPVNNGPQTLDNFHGSGYVSTNYDVLLLAYDVLLLAKNEH